MIFHFDEVEGNEIYNMRDGDGSAFMKSVDDEMVSIKKMVLHAGSSVGFHQHVGTSEIIYLLEGRGQILEGTSPNPEECTLRDFTAGQVAYCPEGAYHSFINNSDKDLIAFAIVPNQKRD